MKAIMNRWVLTRNNKSSLPGLMLCTCGKCSLVPSPFLYPRERVWTNVYSASVTEECNNLNFRWALIRKHIGIINILVVPLALQPAKHKQYTLLDLGLLKLINKECCPRQKARKDTKKL